jgi:beta-alanine--pyruvate transaminase
MVFEAGVLVRWTGDILAFSPPLIVEKAQIERIFATVREALDSLK